mgnify:CR=1 FL=1
MAPDGSIRYERLPTLPDGVAMPSEPASSHVPVAAANSRKAASPAGLSSVAGGLLGYAIGWGLWDSVGAQLIGLLGMTDSFPVAACYLREFDFEAILIAGATPVPFKLLTIASGFVGMNLVTFVLASIVGRGMIFFTVGVLFRVFGAPIKRFIDEYLGLVTIAFVALVVGGVFVLTMVGSGEEDPADACSGATYESLGLEG